MEAYKGSDKRSNSLANCAEGPLEWDADHTLFDELHANLGNSDDLGGLAVVIVHFLNACFDTAAPINA